MPFLNASSKDGAGGIGELSDVVPGFEEGLTLPSDSELLH